MSDRFPKYFNRKDIYERRSHAFINKCAKEKKKITQKVVDKATEEYLKKGGKITKKGG